MKKIASIILASVIFSPINVSAESLNQYAQTCKAELELKHIPAFSCFDGIHSPGVDSGAYLGKLDTGNKDVQAVYLCRYAIGEDSPSLLVGLIIQNVSNRKTCFFDTQPEADDPANVPSVLAAGADTYWKSPDEMISSSITLSHCHQCHNNDVFLAVDGTINGLSELDLFNTNRPLIGSGSDKSYEIIGSAFNAAGWNQQLTQTAGDPGCQGCHQSSTSPYYLNQISGSTALNQMPPAPGSIWVQQPLPIYEWGQEELIRWQNTGSEGWTVQAERTPSSNTGPETPPDTDPNYNYGTVEYFYFMETSGGAANSSGNDAILTSPYFNGENAALSFEYHMWGSNIGSLFVDIEINGDWNNNVWSRTGDQGNFWKGALINLDELVSDNESIRVRLRGVAAGGWQGDIAIGKIALTRFNPVELKSRATGECLAIEGIGFSEGPVYLDPCSSTNFQNLFLREVEPNNFQLGNRDNGLLCNIVYRFSSVQGYSCSATGGAKQHDLWTIEMLDNGYTMLRSKFNPAKCMSVYTDPNWSTWSDCSTSDLKQQWLVTQKPKLLVE